MLFHGPTLPWYLINIEKCIKKCKICYKNYSFAKNVRVRVRNEFWAKRTCDVRAAQIKVCECPCVRPKNPSQLTLCKLDCRWHTVYISWKLVVCVVPKFLKLQDFITTFQKNLTCILFLSLRANLKKTVCHDWPCTRPKLFWTHKRTNNFLVCKVLFLDINVLKSKIRIKVSSLNLKRCQNI